MIAGQVLCVLVSLGLPCAPVVAESTSELRQPWDTAYAGNDVAGDRVIALWSFDTGAELRDSSRNGHHLRVHGAKIAQKGRFGGALESFRGHPAEDKRHAAVAKDHPDLSPQGPFTIELWVRPGKELEGYPESFLLDKKYVAHDDYQLVLSKANRNGARTLTMNLGFGKESAWFRSDPLELEPGTWVHIAFTYNGAGLGRFFLNGQSWGKTTREGRASIHPGKRDLSIGDRIGSYYHGFPGLIDQVRLCKGVLEFRGLEIGLRSTRSVFVRMAEPPPLKLDVRNLRREPMTNATLTTSVDGIALDRIRLPAIPSGQTHTADCKFDTRLRPDAYRLVVEVRSTAGDSAPTTEWFPFRIVPRTPPHVFPVVMWGVYSPEGVRKEMARLRRIGFTHVLGFGADFARIWDAEKPTAPAEPDKVAATRRMLDEALAGGLRIASSLSPGRFARKYKEHLRVDRQGKPLKDENVCGLSPEVIQFCRNVGESVGREYGDHPAFQAVLAHTEIRDHASPCFHDHDRKAYREHAGADIPDQVTSKRGVSYEKLQGFPKSHLIPDDHPILRYCRWYWKHGDGWNGLNSALAEGLKRGGADVWTWFDPAVRVASVYGSGGKIDVLSHWTYSYPDPIRIAIATDELFAMAAGATPPQDVMKMTQIIWYRSQTAPESKKDDPLADKRPKARWEREQPDAPFITIAPMHLREAFWTKIARPIRGIMYHGWQSLVPCESSSGYRYTHPQTQHELARLIDEVVRPLGPTLLQVPGAKSDVAFLESFAAQMFAGRGTYGWGGSWVGDAYLMTLYAHLQPEIVYDETIADRGLDGFRVLVMPHCDVLPQSVARKVAAFQKRGGIVVGDPQLAPAIKPDILIEPLDRSGQAKLDKANLLARAAALRKSLDAKYERYVDATEPDVIPYRRRCGDTDYVFLVNDRREFGDYVGQHGKVMEIGLQTRAVVSIRRPAGCVYDLATHRRLPARQKDGRLEVDVTLGPCDGTLLMITPQPIERVAVKAPEQVQRGQDAACHVDVLSADGKGVNAVVPMEIRVRDPEGHQAEYSGFYGAANGSLDIRLSIAPNDLCGTWQVEVRELAGGRRATGYFRVVR